MTVGSGWSKENSIKPNQVVSQIRIYVSRYHPCPPPGIIHKMLGCGVHPLQGLGIKFHECWGDLCLGIYPLIILGGGGGKFAPQFYILVPLKTFPGIF